MFQSIIFLFLFYHESESKAIENAAKQEIDPIGGVACYSSRTSAQWSFLRCVRALSARVRDRRS